LEKDIILKMEHITKIFPGVKALDDVSLEIRRGEVLSLLGENGAGKSTLIKVLSGIYIPEGGTISCNGTPVKLHGPADAKEMGISVVHQELAFLPLLTIAENLYVRHYADKKKKLVSWKDMESSAQKALEMIDLEIDQNMPIGNCSVAECQQIEIARAVYENAKILILDEPTSALNDRETDALMECIRKLREKGVSVILITHKIEEIMRIADRVVVLRDGHTVGECKVSDVTKDDLIAMMVGRKMEDMYPEKTNTPREVLMTVEDFGTDILENIHFSVRRGEILGVYGLMGSGHLELGQALFGCYPKYKGKVILEGEGVSLKSPEACIRKGIAFLPSDRKQEGLVLMHGVKSNIMTPYYQTGTNSWIVNHRREREIGQKWVERLRIKTPTLETSTDSLSGGNQQKVVFAKWLEIDPKIVILNDPTRGIDVGAKAEIYSFLNELTEKGVSVLMITSEMPELIAMSDRVLVIHEGKQSALLSKEEMTQTNIVAAAIGGIQKDE
jgi:ribose transport system ATP-binding protein